MKERISKNLGIPFVTIEDENKNKHFVCQSGVAFSEEEYLKGIDVVSEHIKRQETGDLYDFEIAKEQGELKKLELPAKEETEEVIVPEEIKEDVKLSKEDVKLSKENKTQKAVYGIVLLLAFTSVISMYVSTLHTATYLTAYADVLSSWLMSASVTVYNATAFEVSILFKKNKRNIMSFTFMFLWGIVTLFSMITTVSVFYDEFSFNSTELAQENKQILSQSFSLELLQKKEADLRSAIEFKKKDIEYRQKVDYATTSVRNELTVLENELQKNLTEQQNLLSETPQAVEGDKQIKKTLFAFLGDFFGFPNDILEFIMSTLSAVFINLICPLSLTAVVELFDSKHLTSV